MIQTKTAPDPDLLNLIVSLNAGFPLLAIPTREEHRLCEWLYSRRGMLRGPERKIRVWSVTSGLVSFDPSKPSENKDETRAPGRALQSVLDEVQQQGARAEDEVGSIYIFRDLHPFYQRDREVVRLLRDISRDLKGTLSTVILVSPKLEIPEDLEGDIEVCDFPLPSRDVIGRSIYDDIVNQLVEEGKEVDRSPDLREAVLRATSGMTFNEADNALAKALAEAGGLGSGVVPIINREKRRFVRRLQGVDLITPREGGGLHSVGGFQVAKDWISERGLAFSDEARRYGLQPPKGITVVGLPGAGKSLLARGIAEEWGLTLLRLDMAAIKEGVIGRSAANLKAALEMARALAPCVLWADEIEKAFAGASATWVGDSGVAKELFGMFLTWLQDQTGVFVYATANDISALPPELLRKGRFDEMFFVNFPSTVERAEILAIHLRAVGRTMPPEVLLDVAEHTPLFVGAELEQVVKDALFRSYRERQAGRCNDMEPQHLIDAATRMVPLAQTKREQIRSLMRFAQEQRAVDASAPLDPLTSSRVESLIEMRELSPAFA